MARNPSASYSLTMRLEIPCGPGTFARVASAIADARGDVGAIDLVRVTKEHTSATSPCRRPTPTTASRSSTRCGRSTASTLVNVCDRTFLMHLGGKIEVANKVPVKTRDDLSMAYTPGVARVCLAIADDVDKARALTIKQNTVAVVTDGTAVLGLGDIGPRGGDAGDGGQGDAVQGVRRHRRLAAGLDTKDADEIVAIVKAIAPGFGGINLEDIAAPRCFEIEGRLRRELDIPVFHDDQHGTAVVVLAGLLNAAKLVEKRMDELKVVLVGVGAAGVAVTKLLLRGGRHRHRRLRPRGRAVRRQEGPGRDQEVVRQAHQPARRSRARPRRRWRAPTCSSACPARAPSASRRSDRWPTTRSCSRWPTPTPRCRRRRSRATCA